MNVATKTNRRRPPHPRRPRPTHASPLTSIVACLSGQTPSQKTHLESLISNLGGISVRDFDPAYVTHLILDEPKGSKYEYVQRNKGREFAKKLFVVRSDWVLDCEQTGKRCEESLYGVEDKTDEEKKNGVLPQEIQNVSLDEACEWMLCQAFPRMFLGQSFLLVGFDISGKSLVVNSEENKSMQLMVKLSKLIRRAGGTIYWSPNDVITAVVLSDSCSEIQW